MGMVPRNKIVNPSQPSKGTASVARRLPPSPSPAKRSRLRSLIYRKSFWLAVTLLVLTTSVLVGSGWLAVTLIVNPQSLSWVNRWVPNWVPALVTGVKPPQTLEEIQTEIRKSERIPGETLSLGKNKSFLDNKTTVSDLLLPVWKRQSVCQNDCDQIVEVRLYQSVPAAQRSPNNLVRFQLIDQLAIDGPEESFVISPLVDAHSANQGSSRSLPLTSLTLFDGTVPNQGIWLNLSGQLNRADYAIAYGEILHYNPARLYLSTMLEWCSTTGEQPRWQQVTGGGLPEIVVNQTVGMEPRFKMYQVQPRSFVPNPIQLEPVLLMDSALNDQIYKKGLLLARQGLWSIGWQWMASVKRSRKSWPASAQAQMDLVRLHAQATQDQAEKSWASPNQQVLVNLIDGRWARALQVFNASPENSLETDALLKSDFGQLRDRVDAALQVNPAQLDVKTWGALLIAAQSGKAKAIAWLKKQPRTTTRAIQRIEKEIDRLNPPLEAETELKPAP